MPATITVTLDTEAQIEAIMKGDHTMTTQFIAIDEHGIAIQAIGSTADEAISTAIRDAGPLFDAEGDDLTDEEARMKFITRPATPALIAQVEAEGGAIAWGEIDGTACTVEEEEGAA